MRDGKRFYKRVGEKAIIGVYTKSVSLGIQASLSQTSYFGFTLADVSALVVIPNGQWTYS